MSLLSPLARTPDFVCTDRPVPVMASTQALARCAEILPPVRMEDTCVCAARKGEECRDESQTSCVMVVASALSGIDVNRTRTSCPNESAARGRKSR